MLTTSGVVAAVVELTTLGVVVAAVVELTTYGVVVAAVVVLTTSGVVVAAGVVLPSCCVVVFGVTIIAPSTSTTGTLLPFSSEMNVFAVSQVIGYFPLAQSSGTV